MKSSFLLLLLLGCLWAEDKSIPTSKSPDPEASLKSGIKILDSLGPQVKDLESQINSYALKTQALMLQVKDIQIQILSLKAQVLEECRTSKGPKATLTQDSGGGWACQSPSPEARKEQKK